MKGNIGRGRFGALAVAVAACAVLFLLPISAGSATDDSMQVSISMPAVTGAGGASTVNASSATDTAWIYTGDFVQCIPQKTTGSIALCAIDETVNDVAGSGDRATMMAKFQYPSGGSTYTVTLSCISPVGTSFNHFGGVGILRPVFGSTGIGIAAFPRTVAYASVFGNATITKDGESIAENQPVMVFVTPALHDSSQKWMADADTSSQEIHLVVPGPMLDNGPSLTGFTNGNLYIYWPQAAINMSNIGGAVTGCTAAPSSPGQCASGPDQTTPYARTITVDDNGITSDGDTCPGWYNLTMINSSGSCLGLVMTGRDVCCSTYHRFSNFMRPGERMTFRWFFPAGDVSVREYLDAKRAGRTFDDLRFGPHSATMTFGE